MDPSLDSRSSQRLALLRFPLIVGVVFIHAYSTTVQTASEVIGTQRLHPAVVLFIELLSQGLARSAVPCFFLISGLLFFQGFEPTWAGYREKWRGRLRTLLLPYLFWNLLTAALFALAQTLPATRGYFSGASAAVLSLSPSEFVAALFGVGRMPLSYPFWFIRDLMLLVLLAPLLGALLQRLGAYLLLPLFASWLFWPNAPAVPSLVALSFFALGAWFALARRSVFALDRWSRFILPAYALALPLVVAAPWDEWRPWLHQGLVALGVAAALVASGWLVDRPAWRERLLALSGASFFVFAAHEPLLTIARKLTYRLLQPDHSLVVLALYLAIPLGVVLLLLLLHSGLRWLAPQPLAWVTGGR